MLLGDGTQRPFLTQTLSQLKNQLRWALKKTFSRKPWDLFSCEGFIIMMLQGVAMNLQMTGSSQLVGKNVTMKASDFNKVQ